MGDGSKTRNELHKLLWARDVNEMTTKRQRVDILFMKLDCCCSVTKLPDYIKLVCRNPPEMNLNILFLLDRPFCVGTVLYSIRGKQDMLLQYTENLEFPNIFYKKIRLS